MNEQLVISELFVFIGIPLLIQYFSVFFKKPEEINNLWSNNGSNIITNKQWLKSLYKFSIILSVLAGLYIFGYLASDNYAYDYDTIFTGLLFLLFFSFLWLPSFYSGYKKLNTFILLIVSLGALLIFIGIVSKHGYNNTSIDNVEQITEGQITEGQINHDVVFSFAGFFAFYLFFHTFVFDFVIWSGIFDLNINK